MRLFLFWRVFRSQNRKSTFAEYARLQAVLGIVRKQDGGGRKVTSGGNSHEWRTWPHEMRQALRPNRLLVLLALAALRDEALAAPLADAGEMVRNGRASYSLRPAARSGEAARRCRNKTSLTRVSAVVQAVV